MTTVFYTQHELTRDEIRADEVRNAAIARNRAMAPEKQIFIKDPTTPATDPQKGKIRALLATLRGVNFDVWQQASVWIDANIDSLDKGMASKTIDRLKLRIAEVPVAPTSQELETVTNNIHRFVARDKFADVPDGYYAVTAEEGHLAFYRVSTWKSGDRKVQVQASDELHQVKGHKAADAILAKVREVTAPLAGKLYADEIGNCWRCGRTLTDAESRARGIGPVCINKA